MSRTRPLTVLVVFLVASSFLASFATGAAAQEVETEIRFESEVVEGEETTITYVTRVVETPVETDVNAEVTLLVDGEVMETVSTKERVSDGAEIRTEFTHTFDSPGEKRVTVNGTASVSPFGPELSDSTTATVTVLAAEEGGAGEGEDTNESEDAGDVAGSDTEEERDTDDGNDTEDEGGAETDTGGTTDDESDTSSGNESEKETENEAESDRQGQGLPGFTLVTALLALTVGTAAVAGRRTTRQG